MSTVKLLFLFTGLFLTLLGRSTTATSTLVNISCYKTQPFDAADIPNNTQLVVSGCDGRGQGSALFATMILIQFSTTSSPLTNLTILVQNSVSANVVIEGNATAPTMIGLSITMINVTNPAAPSPPAGLDCTTSSHPWCLAMVSIVGVDVLLKTTISLTNVILLRNITHLVRLALWSRMSDAMIFVGNATYSGGMACVTLGESGEATNSNITIVNTTTVARGVFATNSATALILDVGETQLALVSVVLDNVVVTDNPISGGLVSGGGSIAALFFANTTITAASFVIIRNSLIDVYNAARGRILYLLQSTLSSSHIEVANTRLVAKALTAVTGVQFFESSAIDGSTIQIIGVTVTTANFASVFSCLGSFSNLNASSMLISGSAFSSFFVGSALYFADATSVNSTVVVVNTTSSVSATTTNPTAVAVLVDNALWHRVNMRFTNVSCNGGYAAFTLRSSTILNSVIIIASSVVSQSSIALLLASAMLSRDSSLSITSTRFAVRSQGISIQGSTIADNSIMNVSSSVFIDNSTSPGSGIRALYLVDTTIDSSTLIASLVSSPSFIGTPLVMSTVELYHSSNLTFDMGDASWSRPSTFDAYLVYFGDSSIVVASTVSITLPASIQRSGAELGSYTQKSPFYLSECLLAKGAVVSVHGSPTVDRTEVKWPSMLAVVYVVSLTIETGAQLRFSSLLLHNVIAGTAFVINNGFIDGSNSSVSLVSITVHVGPRTGVPALTAGTMFGLCITMSTVQNFAAVRMTSVLCVHDMSQLDTRCVVVTQSIFTGFAVLYLANFSGPVSSGAVPVTLQGSYVLNMSRVIAWENSVVGVNATVSNVSLTGPYRVGFALIVIEAIFANSSLAAFPNSVMLDISSAGITPALAAAWIMGVYLVTMTLVDSTIILTNFTFTQCPQQNTTRVELFNITDGCILNASTIIIKTAKMDCGVVVNSDNSTVWDASEVRLRQLLVTRSLLSYLPASLISFGGSIAGEAAGLRILVGDSVLDFSDTLMSIGAARQTSLSSAPMVRIDLESTRCNSAPSSTSLQPAVVALTTTTASFSFLPTINVSLSHVTLAAPWTGLPSLSLCSSSSTCVAIVSLASPTVIVSLSLKSVAIVGTTQLISTNALTNAASVDLYCASWRRHMFSEPKRISNSYDLRTHVFVHPNIAVDFAKSSNASCVAAKQWNSLTDSLSTFATVTQTTKVTQTWLRHTATQTISSSLSLPILDDLSLTAPPLAPGITAASLTATAGAVLSGGGGAIGEAASLAALAMITCGGQRTFGSNTGVQRLVISVFYDLGPVASVWGNLGIAAVVFVVHFGLVTMIESRRSRAASRQEKHHRPLKAPVSTPLKPPATQLRFPSHSNVVFLFLLPGVLFASAGCFAPTEGSTTAVATGAIGILMSCVIVGMSVRHAAAHVWPLVDVVSTTDDFKAALPPWFLNVFRNMLPAVAWTPKELKLQGSSFFSAMASRKVLRLQPLLHVHGAIFSLVAGLPFPSSACPAQFAVLMVWALVPLLPQCVYRLHVLRRPPSNVLSVASSLLAVCIVACNAVFFEGPASLGDGARSALSVFGYMLTVVSGLKIIISISGIIIEKYVRRRTKDRLPSTSDRLKLRPKGELLLLESNNREDLNDNVYRHKLGDSPRRLYSSSYSITCDFTLGNCENHASQDGSHNSTREQQPLPLDLLLEIARLDVFICDAVLAAQGHSDADKTRRITPEEVLSLLVNRVALLRTRFD